MTVALRELERHEWRVLGALRLVDATTRAPIERGLQIEAPGAKLVRNRSGLYVIHRWSALAAHESEFQSPPAQPPIGSQSLAIRVSDPSGNYLPVAAQVALPRNPDPALADTDGSLFQPAVVPLYPSASAPVGAKDRKSVV